MRLPLTSDANLKDIKLPTSSIQLGDKSEDTMNPSSGLTALQERLTEHLFTFASLLKDMIQATDEQPMKT